MERRHAITAGLLLSLAGCHPWTEPAGALVAADAASVAVFGRDIGDILISGISGRDCSIVRLERGQSYCRPIEPPPAAPAFCTKTLGFVNCWADPDGFAIRPHELADGPRTLTPEQDKNRTRRWPGF